MFRPMPLAEQLDRMARSARQASRKLACLSEEERNGALMAMGEAIDRSAASIQKANLQDLEAGRRSGLSSAMLDRLELTDARIAAMSRGLREVAELPDPVGRVLDRRERPNGLRLHKVATPLGVILIIYESRPNVTVDAAGLCLKSGNATILRGGKEALHSNRILARTMVEAARERSSGFPQEAIQVVPVTDREAVPILLSMTGLIDLCMPRGGEGLIRAVSESARIPVIKHHRGLCHVYVDRDADPQRAVSIPLNAKTQRPGVCNAMETLLIDQALDPGLIARIVGALAEKGVEIRGDGWLREVLKGRLPAGARLVEAEPEDWDREYLDLILAARSVPGADKAIEHVNEHGSGLSEAIVTENPGTARRFLEQVDASAVYWNASTRFTDGAEFGLGAEIGISTDKIGARGPMGLEELTSYKWLGYGEGHIRV